MPEPNFKLCSNHTTLVCTDIMCPYDSLVPTFYIHMFVCVPVCIDVLVCVVCVQDTDVATIS